MYINSHRKSERAKNQGWASSLALSCALQAFKDWFTQIYRSKPAWYMISLCHAYAFFVFCCSFSRLPPLIGWTIYIYTIYIIIYGFLIFPPIQKAVGHLLSEERGLQHEQPCVGLGSHRDDGVGGMNIYIFTCPRRQTHELCAKLWRLKRKFHHWFARRHLPFEPRVFLTLQLVRSSFSGDTR